MNMFNWKKIATENSKISTFELDFQFSPHKEMFEKSGDVLFNPEKKIIKNEIPDN